MFLHMFIENLEVLQDGFLMNLETLIRKTSPIILESIFTEGMLPVLCMRFLQ